MIDESTSPFLQQCKAQVSVWPHAITAGYRGERLSKLGRSCASRILLIKRERVLFLFTQDFSLKINFFLKSTKTIFEIQSFDLEQRGRKCRRLAGSPTAQQSPHGRI